MKLILKNTETQAVVKLSATAGSTDTITLGTDFLVPNRVVLDGKPFKVNITDISFAGLASSSFTITRNAVQIFASSASDPTQFMFSELDFVDSQESASDLVVAITGNATVYINFRKQQGYVKTFEPEIYGPLDNPSIAGA